MKTLASWLKDSEQNRATYQKWLRDPTTQFVFERARLQFVPSIPSTPLTGDQALVLAGLTAGLFHAFNFLEGRKDTPPATKEIDGASREYLRASGYDPEFINQILSEETTI